jgi:hypothetical protein
MKPFASIRDILAFDRAHFASERRGQRRTRRTALQVTAFAPAILRRESNFKFILSRETHIMDATSKTALVIAIVITAALLLLIGGGIATETTFSGGMMGNGSMDGIGWTWLPTLLVVVLGVVLISVISGKK